MSSRNVFTAMTGVMLIMFIAMIANIKMEL